MPRPQVLSIPERLDAHPRLAGKGVVIGFVDSGFYPHPDLMLPRRRIKVYADATRDVPIASDFFTAQVFGWHGTMAVSCAAGNGYVSGGRYRGLASEADVVLIKASTEGGRLRAKDIAHAIRFPLRHPELGIRVLNVSVGTFDSDPDRDDVSRAVKEVVAAGVTLFAPAGNRSGHPPTPPGSCADAITVGGLDDHNTMDRGDDKPWPSSYGMTPEGVMKPDLLAPALWLPAPMLPGTLVAREAAPLFQLLSVLEEASSEYGFSEQRSTATHEERASVAALVAAVGARISRKKYISPDYQHVEGTSFASPITASVAAQMLEADPTLTPAQIREALVSTAQPIQDVPRERQGAGLLRPRIAVEWAISRAAVRSTM